MRRRAVWLSVHCIVLSGSGPVHGGNVTQWEISDQYWHQAGLSHQARDNTGLELSGPEN